MLALLAAMSLAAGGCGLGGFALDLTVIRGDLALQPQLLLVDITVTELNALAGAMVSPVMTETVPGTALFDQEGRTNRILVVPSAEAGAIRVEVVARDGVGGVVGRAVVEVEREERILEVSAYLDGRLNRDLDGDGYADVAVGAPGAGKVFVYRGGEGANLNRDSDEKIAGDTADQFGISVALVGDLNGDGFGDLVVGAPYEDADALREAGAVYVYLGRPGPKIDGVPDRVLTGLAAGDRFGFAVAAAGDLNDDGYDDLLVGAPAADTVNGADTGAAYVFNGGPGPTLDSTPDATLVGEERDDTFGFSLARLGDLDGLGGSDVIVGAPAHDLAAVGVDVGRAYVFTSAAGTIDDLPERIFDGAAAGDSFGWAVAGVDDEPGALGARFAIGAWGDDGAAPDAGAVYVFRVDLGAIVLDEVLDGTVEGARFGIALAGADVDGDGATDLLVGADGPDAGNCDCVTGAVHAYRGPAPFGDATPVSIVPDPRTPQFGRSLAAAGDLNGDGLADFLVGAPESGEVFAYFGGDPLAVEPAGSLGRSASSGFGSAVARAADASRAGAGASGALAPLEPVTGGQPRRGPRRSGPVRRTPATRLRA